MTERPKLGQLIDSIQEKAKVYEASVNETCRGAVDRRFSPDAKERMDLAASYLSRHHASQELAKAVIELLHRFWPAKELQMADELARDARAYIEANGDQQRENLKAGYFRYIKERGLKE